MKFTDLPQELQDIFVETFIEVKSADNEIKKIDKKISKLLNEDNELKHHNNVNARERRNEISRELSCAVNEQTKIGAKQFALKENIYKFIEKMYKDAI